MRFDVNDLVVALGATRSAQTSLTLRDRSVIALSGPSGAGKTTMLRAMAQLVPVRSGDVTLDGQTPEHLGWPTFRRRVVYVAQRPSMLAGTVAENLARAFSYKSTLGAFDPEDARRRLAAVRLPDDVMDRTATELSVGEQQRVAFVRAQLVKPDVYLLDEPTSALDEDAEAALEKLLLDDLTDRNAAAIVVTHDNAQSKRLDAKRIDLSSGEVTP